MKRFIILALVICTVLLYGCGSSNKSVTVDIADRSGKCVVSLSEDCNYSLKIDGAAVIISVGKDYLGEFIIDSSQSTNMQSVINTLPYESNLVKWKSNDISYVGKSEDGSTAALGKFTTEDYMLLYVGKAGDITDFQDVTENLSIRVEED